MAELFKAVICDANSDNAQLLQLERKKTTVEITAGVIAHCRCWHQKLQLKQPDH